MTRLYPALLEAAGASVFLIPYLLHRGRRDENRSTIVLQILFALYLSAVYSLAGLPRIFQIRFRPNVNLTPFLYMFSDHTSSILNVLLFLPLGLFLPVVWTRFRNLFRTVMCGLLLSAAIEFLQLFTCRATDINDLITNTLGTVFGFLAGMLTVKLIPEYTSGYASAPFSTIVTAVFCIMFFLQPLLVQTILYLV